MANNDKPHPPFFAKKIRLQVGEPTLIKEPVIKQTWREEAVRAQSLLAHTQEQCEQLLAQALQHAEQIKHTAKEEASQAVWQSANALLQQWQSQSASHNETLLPQIQNVLQTALQRLCLDISQPDKITALLRQLQQAQGETAQATLYCHPDEVEPVKAQLAKQHNTFWRVIADAELPLGELCLSDAKGDYRTSIALSLSVFDGTFSSLTSLN